MPRTPFDPFERHAGGRRPGHFGHGPPGGPPHPPPPPGVPPGPWGPVWSMFRRHARARRGDVRAAILALLAEEPRNGYQIMQALEQKSGGMWRPSPGSVYPALQLLEDEQLVRVETNESGGRVYHLTDAGRTAIEESEDEDPPWAAIHAGAGERRDLMRSVQQLMAAVGQVAQSGTPGQITKTQQLLRELRREVYGILAEDDEDEPEEDAEE